MKKPQALLKELSLFSELTNFECDHIASLCRLVEGNAGDRLIENSPLLGYKIFKKMAQITSYRLRIASGQLAEYKSVAQSPIPESTG